MLHLKMVVNAGGDENTTCLSTTRYDLVYANGIYRYLQSRTCRHMPKINRLIVAIRW